MASQWLQNVGKKLYFTGSRMKLQAVKHAPTGLVVGGVIGLIGAAVLVAFETPKAMKIVAETHEELEVVKRVANDPAKANRYSEDDRKHDLAIIYAKTSGKLLKVYAPSVILGICSAASVLGGHGILQKRHAALGAAYAVLDKGYREYRERVKDELGEEAEKRIRYALRAREADEIADENSKADESEESTPAHPRNFVPSEYARIFDEFHPEWTKSAEYNLTFLNQLQRVANDKLTSRGHLFLNEVYDLLRFPRTKAGQVIGWVYDPKNPNLHNFVDFGIYETRNEQARLFVNGYERSIILDFNVDGYILNLIEEDKSGQKGATV